MARRRMKVCPNCGFEDRKTLREAVRLWRIHFGDVPIFEMMKRHWIAVPVDYGDLAAIRDELKRFFCVKTDADLAAILSGERGLGIGGNVCNLEPDRPTTDRYRILKPVGPYYQDDPLPLLSAAP